MAIYAVGGGWGAAGPNGRGVTSGAEMAKLAGLDFKVGRRSVQIAGQDAPGYEAIVREDTGETFQIARTGLGIVQPAESLSILDSAVRGNGSSYTSAGSFNRGAQMFVCAVLPKPVEIVPGDLVFGICTLFDSFDSSLRYRVKLSSIRAICQNTADAIRKADARGYEFALKHTSDIESRAKQAAAVFRASIDAFHDMAESYKALARARFTDQDMATLARTLIPVANEAKVPAQAQTARETLSILFSEGKGQAEFAAVRGTKWAALNATTEYVDHLRPTRVRAQVDVEESRLASAWLGSGAALKERAYAYLTA